ncbi:MAG: Crp/Fnr family transcriptional regulator [Gammaproteobacteria bacterium]|nr:Crp/Fnr family transcriptional regulator [Gammaproteobacteria bacterium]
MPSTPWNRFFPDAQRDAELDTVFARAQCLSVPAGTRVFMPEAPCQNYLLVVEGRVRVQLLTASGREVVLYHVGAGESCVLTTACLLGTARYPAEGITETAVTAYALSIADFNRGLDDSASFRRFVFGNLGQRLADVIARMEEIAFAPIDARLAGALLRLVDAQGQVAITHQTLAVELGSAREVVSRHLKRFADNGWVQLGRASIEVTDRAALDALAQRG